MSTFMGFFFSPFFVWEILFIGQKTHIECTSLAVIKELDHTLARKNDSPTWCGVIVLVWCYCGGVVLLW